MTAHVGMPRHQDSDFGGELKDERPSVVMRIALGVGLFLPIFLFGFAFVYCALAALQLAGVP